MASIVLVHGAWHSGSTWGPLIDAWTIDAIPLFAVDLPSCREIGDLSNDAAAVVEFCTNVDDDVILVGHSYGGAVVSRAASSITRLLGIVYLAAIKPDLGESVTDASRRSPKRSELDEHIHFVENEGLYLDPGAKDVLYDGVDADLAAWFMDQLHAQPPATFREPLATTVANDVRTHYILCTQDRVVPPELQALFASTCTTAEELELGHMAHVQSAETVAHALRAAVLGA